MFVVEEDVYNPPCPRNHPVWLFKCLVSAIDKQILMNLYNVLVFVYISNNENHHNLLQETTETIAFRMLDKVVAIELISKTLENQIRPYMEEHRLHQDSIFSRYMKVGSYYVHFAVFSFCVESLFRIEF